MFQWFSIEFGKITVLLIHDSSGVEEGVGEGAEAPSCNLKGAQPPRL